MEHVVDLHANHSNMCRFDCENEADLANYKRVRLYLGKLYRRALEGPLKLPEVPIALPYPPNQGQEADSSM